MLRIACLQTAGVSDSPAANLDELDRAVARAARSGASVLITPELFLTGYDIGENVVHWADEPLLDGVQQVASRHQTHVIIGLPRRVAGAVYNCAVCIDATGAVTATHAKSHLFGQLDRRYFAAGDDPYTMVTIDGVRIALMICYDVEFPEAARSAALGGAQLIAVPTAQMEPFTFVATTVIPARAWENQVYVAYVNRLGAERDTVYVGHSSIVAPTGAALASAELDSTLLTATIDPDVVATAQRANPYLADRRPELYSGGGQRDV